MRSLLSLAPFVFSTELTRGDGPAAAMKRFTTYSCKGKKNNEKLSLLLSYSEAIIPEKNRLKTSIKFSKFLMQYSSLQSWP